MCPTDDNAASGDLNAPSERLSPKILLSRKKRAVTFVIAGRRYHIAGVDGGS